MERNYSTVNIYVSSDNLEHLEKSIESVVFNRSEPCHVRFDFTKANPSFKLLKRSGSIKDCFEKNREKADEIMKSSEIVVNSRPAKFIIGLFLKLAKPSVPVKITVHRD